MELIIIELLLWGALILFFWALKDSLGQVETDIESIGATGSLATSELARPAVFARPEQVIEPIGRYQDALIYQYAVIEGRYYQFDRVVPDAPVVCKDENERCVAPGLIYVAMARSPVALNSIHP